MDRSGQNGTGSVVWVEAIEGRVLLSAALHEGFRPHERAALAHQAPGFSTPQLLADATPASNTYNNIGHKPSDIRTVYQFGALANQGAGQTIAIVDAYDDPNIANDLATFDKQFGLPGPASFQKVSQTGSTVLPKANGKWGQEISLDVEWAHSIAPGANILLVEANSNSNADLLAAVDYAAAHAGVVSMSWGGSEFSTESAYDTHFQTPNVTFVASSGDTGGAREWPAESPYVLSVGGTTLNFNTDNTWKSETGWSNSGGGTSAYEGKPGYQSGLAYNNRSAPDVAYDADPNSGFAVYDSYRYNGASGWMCFGGTSAGAPQWAALIAVANAGRTANLTGYTEVLPSLYSGSSVTGTVFHDITIGSTAGGTSAGIGYDQITGQGSPSDAQQLIADLTNLA